MVAHGEYKRHQEACRFRLVICPGNKRTCNKMIAFCEVEEHVKTCKTISTSMESEEGSGIFALRFNLPEAKLNDLGFVSWGCQMLKSNDLNTCFMNMNKHNNIISMEVVMVGSEEDCMQHKVEISVQSPETEEVIFKSMFSPRPISATNKEEMCLTVKQTSLAKFWQYNKDLKGYNFAISVQIHTI